MSYDYIEKANALIQKTMNLSNDDISNEALEFIKSNKNMINNDLEIKQNEEKREFDVLPEDVYEAVIKDIKSVQKKKYLSEELEDVLNFEFVILDDKYKGRKLWKD